MVYLFSRTHSNGIINTGSIVVFTSIDRCSWSFILFRLREVIAFSENLNKIIDELNKQIWSQRKPWELELQTLEKELVETQAKIDRWHTHLKDAPELSSELSARIEQL